MRVNLGGSANNLLQAVKELRLSWDATREHWRDVKSLEFERKFLEPLPGDAARAIAVMEEISVLLKKIHDDCE